MKENGNVTGLESSTNFADDEKNLVSALIEMVEYGSDDEETKAIEITRKGKVCLSFSIHPLSESDISSARIKATKYHKNPLGSKYPRIAGDLDILRYNNYIIYTATVDEDKKKIWDNKEIKDKYSILDSADTVNLILKAGEKNRVIEAIMDLSGFDNEVVTASNDEYDEFVKN